MIGRKSNDDHIPPTYHEVYKAALRRRCENDLKSTYSDYLEIMTVPIAGRGNEVLGVFALFLSLTTLATVLRVYCRIYLIQKFRVEDWLAVLAWVRSTKGYHSTRPFSTDIKSQALFVCHAAFAINGVYHGTGQHVWDIKPYSEIVEGLKVWTPSLLI